MTFERWIFSNYKFRTKTLRNEINFNKYVFVFMFIEAFQVCKSFLES